MLKLSTMAMTLLAIGAGVGAPGGNAPQHSQRATQDWNSLPAALQPAIPSASHTIDPDASLAAPPISAWAASLRGQTPFSTVLSAFDLVIIPGHSMGPITAETSYSDLTKIFEANRLKEIETPLEGGIIKTGTRVNLGETRSFTIVWADTARTRVAEIRDIGSDWRTPEGIQSGISLEELEAILGPFQLSGFAWDYGGTVRLEGTTLDSYDSQLIVRLQPTPADTRRSQALREVLGDELVDSDHESFDEIYPIVDEIIVSLAKPRTAENLWLW